MNQVQRIRTTFLKEGYKNTDLLRRTEFENFLNSILAGEPFSPEVASEIWDETSNGRPQASVEDLVRTIAKAQTIIQNRLNDITDQIKSLEGQRQNSKIQAEIDQLNEQKVEYQFDLRYLTEPFGINRADLLTSVRASRYNNNSVTPGGHLDDEGNELQLRWLFFLSAGFGLLEVIVIFQKYDFLNLMVLVLLMFIFAMKHFDSNYIKSTLLMLVISEVLDMIWLFMNSDSYWSPPSEGVNSSSQQGYLKIIILLTYLGIFLKIPLGVFLFHYRNAQSNRIYNLDIGIAKISLTPNESNPFSEGIKDLFN